MIRRPPRSTLFPSTPLSRSYSAPHLHRGRHPAGHGRDPQGGPPLRRERVGLLRSEEHTSELQSRLHLVCRLLLEKKKKQYHTYATRQQPYPHNDHTCTLITC